MKPGLLSRIKFARARKFILALLAVFIVLTLNYAFEIPKKSFGAGITVVGNTINFGSGYYTIDSNGGVYQKTGSEIENTPGDMYPFVSYLSDPYIYLGSQLIVTPASDVVVANGATVLMEGSQTFNSLDVQTGGAVSQPQPDRNGKINSYQYSDQEWGVIFYGYLKVNNAEQRKLTCQQDYYTNPTTNLGNGCVVSFSNTLGADIFSLGDWQNFDQVWQTDVGVFSTNRYAGGPVINNTSGLTQYYPFRVKFKNDNRDDRIEPMRVVLRDGANAVIGSADGVDISSTTGSIFGVDPASGLADNSADGQGRVNMRYYLLDQYIATPAQPTLGWILEDFSNAYMTYETFMNSAPTMKFTNFFNNNYGERTDGLFDLQFRDTIAYDGFASSPFAKGTTGAVYDPEAYRNCAFSVKNVNPNIKDYPLTRYVEAGLSLTIIDHLTMSGGYIDVSGKGYPGYSMDLRTENDATTFTDERGGAPVLAPNSGGLSTTAVPQSAAHAVPDGLGGTGRDKAGTPTGKNVATYAETTTNLSALGSGSGSASQGSAIPTHGGNGGGYIKINANTINFSSLSTGIKANGGDGYRVASGWTGSGGGSGGTVWVSATILNYPAESGSSTPYFESQGGVGYNSTDLLMSSGGGGGYILISVSEFYRDGDPEILKNRIRETLRYGGGVVGEDLDYYGGFGRGIITFIPTADITFPDVEKNISITPYEDSIQVESHDNTKSYQIFPDDTVDINLTVHGMADPTAYRPKDVDIVLVSDTSQSMGATVDGKSRLQWLKEAAQSLFESAHDNNQYQNPNQVSLGLVNFNSLFGWTSERPLGGCEVDVDNPFGKTCSFSYTVGGDSNYMSTDPDEFITDFNTYVHNYSIKWGTPTGAGLNNAIDHLLSPNSRSKETTSKFIILITDGEEILPPCIGSHTDPAPERDAYVCDPDLFRFTDPSNPDYLIPEADYPLARMRENDIGLITIAPNPGVDPFTHVDFELFSINVSELARPYFFPASNPSNIVYYGVDDITKLRDAFDSTLYSIISSQPKGMKIQINETLPPGVKFDSAEIMTPQGLVSDIAARCTSSSADSENRQKVICNINAEDYPEDLTVEEFNEQDFTVTLTVKPGGGISSGGFADLDQNRECYSGDDSEELGPLLVDGLVSSYVEYQPEGPYNVEGENKKETPRRCRQFFSNVVSGDVFSIDDYLNNFALYGRSLNQSSGNTYGAGGSWLLPNYSFNPDAQASYSADQIGYILGRIGLLEADATTVPRTTLENADTWYLQSGELGRKATEEEINSHPEGKVWRIWLDHERDIELLNRITYKGKGTIIIDGMGGPNVLVKSGVSIVPDTKDDSLGIIVVTGNTTFEGGTDSKTQTIKMASFTKGNLNINGPNIRATGSFVARNFNIGTDATNGIRFYYDRRLDSYWPPGFRYFSMPTTRGGSP